MFPLSTGNFCKVQTGRVWALLEQALVTGLPVMALQDLAQSWKAAGLPPMTPGQPQSHHYPNVKLQQTSLLCNKSILIWASLEKKKKINQSKTIHTKAKPSQKNIFPPHPSLLILGFTASQVPVSVQDRKSPIPQLFRVWAVVYLLWPHRRDRYFYCILCNINQNWLKNIKELCKKSSTPRSRDADIQRKFKVLFAFPLVKLERWRGLVQGWTFNIG